jgi:hypothetical protein
MHLIGRAIDAGFPVSPRFVLSYWFRDGCEYCRLLADEIRAMSRRPWADVFGLPPRADLLQLWTEDLDAHVRASGSAHPWEAAA